MPRVKKILAPTDFSELSKLGIRYAFDMARDTGAEVFVYHIIDLGGEWRGIRTDRTLYHDMLEEHRRHLVDGVYKWTGVRRTLVRALVDAVAARLRALELTAPRERSRAAMVELSVYLTTLAMTFLTGNRPLRHRKA